VKKDKPSKHKPILKRNPIVRELIAKPKRNVGRHKTLTNVRNNKADIEEM
jgi:hypothetical protein